MVDREHFSKDYREASDSNCHYLIIEVEGPQHNATDILDLLEGHLPEDLQHIASATILPLWAFCEKLGGSAATVARLKSLHERDLSLSE